MPLSRFARAAWAVLVANLAVIAWGAFVRASGSGAGCGSHWPLCDGQVVPRAPDAAQMIEFTHRLTSGIALLLVVWLLAWALLRRAATLPAGALPAGAGRVRAMRAAWRSRWTPELWAAVLTMAFMLSEALVGAGLVLFGLTGDNASVARAVVLAIHLVNTFFLIGFLALLAWFASGGRAPRWSARDGVGPLLVGALVGTLLLGMTGAVTALGDTLFPAATLAEGVRRDFSATAHFLERLRVIHPLLAVALGLYVLYAAHAVITRRPDATSRRLARALVALFFVQLGAGAINLLLMAPVWMQLVHLLLADLLWITLVLLTATALAPPAAAERAAVAAPPGAGARDARALAGRR